jgi:DNA modification methylase
MNNIICGDSAIMLLTLEPESIDLTVTSPPYDDMDENFNPIQVAGLRDYKGYSWDFKAIVAGLYRVTKPGGVVVWVVDNPVVDGSESLASDLQKIYFRRVGFRIHDTMIYAKNGSAHPDPLRYHQVFEYMIVMSKGRPKTVNLLMDRKNKWGGASNFGTRTNREKDGDVKVGTTKLAGRTVKDYGARWNIWEINNGYGYSAEEDYAYQHPAIFPEALALGHILTWTNPNDTVLDPFCGSGTTLKMAQEAGRHGIGIEYSPEYCKLAEKRVRGANVPLPFFAAVQP